MALPTLHRLSKLLDRCFNGAPTKILCSGFWITLVSFGLNSTFSWMSSFSFLNHLKMFPTLCLFFFFKDDPSTYSVSSSTDWAFFLPNFLLSEFRFGVLLPCSWGTGELLGEMSEAVTPPRLLLFCTEYIPEPTDVGGGS